MAYGIRGSYGNVVTRVTPRNTVGLARNGRYGQGSGGGGGGLGGVNLEKIFKQINEGQDKANAANEARYSEIKQGRQSLYDTMLGRLEQHGQAGRARIDQDYKDLTNTSLARLASRGLASSNLDTTTRLGVERRKQDAIGNFDDQLLERRAGIERGLADDLYKFVERRDDEGPDMKSILSLFGNLGSSGALGSGGGGLSQILQALLKA